MAWQVIWFWNASYRGEFFSTAMQNDSANPTAGRLMVQCPRRNMKLKVQDITLGPGGSFTLTEAAGWAAIAQAAIEQFMGVG